MSLRRNGAERFQEVWRPLRCNDPIETLPEDIEGVTKTPRLPTIGSGRIYLDVEPGTSLPAIREETRFLRREVLSVFDADGGILYAPIVGEEAEVSTAGIAGFFKDRIVTHNHPRGGMLSPDDLKEAINANMARIEAVIPDGIVLSWNRPVAGWPDVDAAMLAYKTAFKRAMKTGGKGGKLRNRILAEVNKTLGSADTFGDRALLVETSSVESE